MGRKKTIEQESLDGADAANVVELDQSRVGRLSRMDAMQQQAMAQESQRRRKIELARIDAALTRLDGGEYGYCLKCDESIPDKRLQVDPASPLCVDCAEKSERKK